jgi:hypothetical protein
MFFADASAASHVPGGEYARVPALSGAPFEWINSEPLTGFDVRNRPIHVTYLDLTHPNSLLLLPHLERWRQDYGPRGLVVVAVHTGEFPTAKDPAVPRAEAQRLGVTIPLVLDPDYRGIAGTNNRYWPAQHLIDRRGYIRYRHYGPGGEDIVEHYLAQLLSEDKDFNAEALSPPLAVTANAWLHPEATPELYAGFRLGSHRAGSWGTGGKPKAFERPAELEAHRLYLEGIWHVCDDHVALASGQGLASFRYTARRVGVFASPGTAQAASWRVRLDGKPVPLDQFGEDLSSNSELDVDRPRFYWLTRHSKLETHQLEVITDDIGACLHRVCFLPFKGEVE